jgi:hypothetical protein
MIKNDLSISKVRIFKDKGKEKVIKDLFTSKLMQFHYPLIAVIDIPPTNRKSRRWPILQADW